MTARPLGRSIADRSIADGSKNSKKYDWHWPIQSDDVRPAKTRPLSKNNSRRQPFTDESHRETLIDESYFFFCFDLFFSNESTRDQRRWRHSLVDDLLGSLPIYLGFFLTVRTDPCQKYNRKLLISGPTQTGFGFLSNFRGFFFRITIFWVISVFQTKSDRQIDRHPLRRCLSHSLFLSFSLSLFLSECMYILCMYVYSNCTAGSVLSVELTERRWHHVYRLTVCFHFSAQISQSFRQTWSRQPT